MRYNSPIEHCIIHHLPCGNNAILHRIISFSPRSYMFACLYLLVDSDQLTGFFRSIAGEIVGFDTKTQAVASIVRSDPISLAQLSIIIILSSEIMTAAVYFDESASCRGSYRSCLAMKRTDIVDLTLFDRFGLSSRIAFLYLCAMRVYKDQRCKAGFRFATSKIPSMIDSLSLLIHGSVTRSAYHNLSDSVCLINPS
jgi:hypothetical protein